MAGIINDNNKYYIQNTNPKAEEPKLFDSKTNKAFEFDANIPKLIPYIIYNE